MSFGRSHTDLKKLSAKVALKKTSVKTYFIFTPNGIPFIPFLHIKFFVVLAI